MGHHCGRQCLALQLARLVLVGVPVCFWACPLPPIAELLSPWPLPGFAPHRLQQSSNPPTSRRAGTSCVFTGSPFRISVASALTASLGTPGERPYLLGQVSVSCPSLPALADAPLTALQSRKQARAPGGLGCECQSDPHTYCVHTHTVLTHTDTLC